MIYLQIYHLAILDSFDTVWNIDHAVIRLLLNLNKDTQVLVLSQSRVRPLVKEKMYALYYDVLDHQNLELTESLFLAKLKRLLKLMEIDDHILHKNDLDIFYGKVLEDNIRYHMLRKSYSTLGKFHDSNHHHMVDNLGFVGEYLALNDILTNKSRNNNIENTKPKIFQNSEKPSIWFWDTNLPFNLAAIRDCEKLYSHDPITVQLLPFLLIYTSHDLSFIYQLEKMNADRSKYTININSMFFALHKLGLVNKPIIETKESFYFRHEYLNDNSTTSKINKTYAAMDDYFDQFAAAYALPNLHCLDYQHAGAQTEGVQVTQIFNLICNRHLKVTNEHCCTM